MEHTSLTFKAELNQITGAVTYSKTGSSLSLTISLKQFLAEDMGVYFFVTPSSIYVGKSRSASGRANSHKSKPWWDKVVKCGLFKCSDFNQDERAAAELELVHLLEKEHTMLNQEYPKSEQPLNKRLAEDMQELLVIAGLLLPILPTLPYKAVELIPAHVSKESQPAIIITPPKKKRKPMNIAHHLNKEANRIAHYTPRQGTAISQLYYKLESMKAVPGWYDRVYSHPGNIGRLCKVIGMNATDLYTGTNGKSALSHHRAAGLSTKPWVFDTNLNKATIFSIIKWLDSIK